MTSIEVPDRLTPILRAAELYMSSSRILPSNEFSKGFSATLLLPCPNVVASDAPLGIDIRSLRDQLIDKGFQVSLSSSGGNLSRLEIRGLPSGMDEKTAADLMRQIAQNPEAKLHPVMKDYAPIDIPNEHAAANMPIVPQKAECKVSWDFQPLNIASTDRGSRSIG